MVSYVAFLDFQKIETAWGVLQSGLAPSLTSVPVLVGGFSDWAGAERFVLWDVNVKDVVVFEVPEEGILEIGNSRQTVEVGHV